MANPLVTLSNYNTAVEANLDRNLLEAAGIRSFLADEAAASTALHLVNAIGGVKLQVSAADVDAARSVLEQPAAALDEFDDSIPDDEFATDDEPPLTATQQNVQRAYRAAVLGVALLPLEFYACWLLLKIAISKEPLDEESKRKTTVAAIVAVPLSLLMLAFVRSLIRV